MLREHEGIVLLRAGAQSPDTQPVAPTEPALERVLTERLTRGLSVLCAGLPSSPLSSTTTILASIQAYASRCARQYAAVDVRRPLRGARSLDVGMLTFAAFMLKKYVCRAESCMR